MDKASRSGSETRPSIFSLPREIRDQIIREVLLPDKSSASYIEDSISIGLESHRLFSSPIIRTCKQLYTECEQIIFRHEFELQSSGPVLASFAFPYTQLSLRRMRSVRRLCITAATESAGIELKMCEWSHGVGLISQKFPNITHLAVEIPAAFMYVFGTHYFGPEDMNGYRFQQSTRNLMEQAWVRSLMTLPTEINIRLLFYNLICSISPCHTKPPHCSHSTIFQWLQEQLDSRGTTVSTVEPDISTLTISNNPGSFNFLGLPVTIQRQIIQHLMLSPNRLLHPCLTPSYEASNRNILPIFLTCHYIHDLAEDVLYSESIFATCADSRYADFKTFMRTRSDRQKRLMRYYYCNDFDHWVDRSFGKFLTQDFPHIRELRNWRDFRYIGLGASSSCCDPPGW